MPKPSQLFQGIGHHMSRVQLMSNCSCQDSWKVFLERSGGLEGAGKAPSSQLPVQKRGGDGRFIKLGISHVPQNHISRGVGQVVDSCILYHFCIFNPGNWGNFDPISRAYFGLKPISRRFWHAHHGSIEMVLKNPLSHEDIQLLGNSTAMLCWWDVENCSGIPGVGFQWMSWNHQTPGKLIGFRGKVDGHYCNSNGFFPGINFVDFGRNMLQFQIYFTLRMPPWSTMVNRLHRNSIAFSSKKSRIWKSCVLDLCVKFHTHKKIHSESQCFNCMEPEGCPVITISDKAKIEWHI